MQLFQILALIISLTCALSADAGIKTNKQFNTEDQSGLPVKLVSDAPLGLKSEVVGASQRKRSQVDGTLDYVKNTIRHIFGDDDLDYEERIKKETEHRERELKYKPTAQDMANYAEHSREQELVLTNSDSTFNLWSELSSLTTGPGNRVLRAKREGFGPWEAQEAWDEQGKSNIVPVLTVLEKEIIQTIKDEAADIAQAINRTAHEAIEVLEHPIRYLMKTKVGIAILCLASLAISGMVCVFVVKSFKFLVIIFKCMDTLVTFLLGLAWKLVQFCRCGVYCCTLHPCLKVRNYVYDVERARKARKNMKIVRSEDTELVEVLTRSDATKLGTDEKGVYLEINPLHRVYFNPETVRDDLPFMKSFTPVGRDKDGSIMKETILQNSKLYKVEKLPGFQGQFEVDGVIIGHFSRILFKGKDCILTAAHVLEYNRSCVVHLRKDDKRVSFESVDARIIAASGSSDLDFLIMEVPSFVFSYLGMKVGKWSSRAQPREVISIYQYFEGKPCVSTSTISVGVKPWHINYGASTLSGSSGAPILDTRNQIIGVHLEHNSKSVCNSGIIPPVFRTPSITKESFTNEDVANGQPEMSRIDALAQKYEYDYRVMMRDNFDEVSRKVGHKSNWAEELDLIDEMFETLGDGKTYDFVSYGVKSGKGKKLNDGTKEGPWTCCDCYCMHFSKSLNCKNCGRPMKPLSKEKAKTFLKGKIETSEFLSQVFPQELVKKIQDLVVDEQQKLDFIAYCTDFMNGGSPVKPDDMTQSVTVPITRTLAGRMEHDCWNSFSGKASRLRVRDDQLVYQTHTCSPTGKETPVNHPLCNVILVGKEDQPRKQVNKRLRDVGLDTDIEDIDSRSYVSARDSANHSNKSSAVQTDTVLSSPQQITQPAQPLGQAQSTANNQPIGNNTQTPSIYPKLTTADVAQTAVQVLPVASSASTPLTNSKLSPSAPPGPPLLSDASSSVSALVSLPAAAKRKRSRKNKNKETAQVSLNSKAPAQTGASTTTGQKKSHSQSNQQKLDGVASSILEAELARRAKSGSQPKNSTQN